MPVVLGDDLLGWMVIEGIAKSEVELKTFLMDVANAGKYFIPCG